MLGRIPLLFTTFWGDLGWGRYKLSMYTYINIYIHSKGFPSLEVVWVYLQYKELSLDPSTYPSRIHGTGRYSLPTNLPKKHQPNVCKYTTVPWILHGYGSKISQLPTPQTSPSHPPVIPWCLEMWVWNPKKRLLRWCFLGGFIHTNPHHVLKNVCLEDQPIHPFGKWFLDHLPIYMPCGRGTTRRVRGLTNHGCWLTKWDDPPSILTSLDVFFYRFKVKSTHLPPKTKNSNPSKRAKKKNRPDTFHEILVV